MEETNLNTDTVVVCRNCGRVIAVAGPESWQVWWHVDNGLPPCFPAMVDPEALLDIEDTKYPIAAPLIDA